MTKDQIIARGREAAAVLENGAFKSAMSVLKSSVQSEWKKCPIRDREGQVLLLQLAKLTDKFEAMLVGMVETGQYELKKLEIDSARDEPAARRFMRKVTG